MGTRKNTFSYGFALALLILPVDYCMATGLDKSEEFELHGFAAQSFIITTGNDFFGNSEKGSWAFQELGVGGLWHPANSLQLALQVVAREAGKTDNGELRVDYGFAEYQLHRSSTDNLGLRVGRMVNPYGFYNDTRDIAATRPSVLLPQSIYFDVNRNFALSSDGVQLYHEHSGDSGDYFFHFGLYEPRMEDPDFEPAIFFQEAPGEFVGARSWMGRLVYEYDFGRIRLGVTAAQVNADYKRGHSDSLSPGEFHFYPILASAQYNGEKWSLTAEYARRRTKLNDFGPSIDVEFSGSSYYLQSVYRVAPRWELLLRYDVLTWNDDDSKGRKLEAATGFPGHIRFAKDWTVGARWDLNQHVMMRTEWHRIEGAGWLSFLENPLTGTVRRNWNLIAFAVSIRF